MSLSSATIATVRSMTGQGHAERQAELGTMTVEIRTVNHRSFKCSLRTGDSLGWIEPRIEHLTRSKIRRGAVHLAIHWQRPPGQGLPVIDAAALESYYRGLEQVRQSMDETMPIDLAALLALPGVIVPPRENWRDHERLAEWVEQTVLDAIDDLNEMREAEGTSMVQSLIGEAETIATRLETIRGLAPRAVDHYRRRLQGKIERALSEHQLEVPAAELLREVQIYADRADISEEVTRLASHLQMYGAVLQGDAGGTEAAGRKLDFIIQELFRETNTIGSKAGDAQIASQVVEIKCALERMRELVQNLE